MTQARALHIASFLFNFLIAKNPSPQLIWSEMENIMPRTMSSSLFRSDFTTVFRRSHFLFLHLYAATT